MCSDVFTGAFQTRITPCIWGGCTISGTEFACACTTRCAAEKGVSGLSDECQRCQTVDTANSAKGTWQTWFR